jgi:hypothetical protein
MEEKEEMKYQSPEKNGPNYQSITENKRYENCLISNI